MSRKKKEPEKKYKLVPVTSWTKGEGFEYRTCKWVEIEVDKKN